MLSALRRIWRSETLAAPATDAALDRVPCGPPLPTMTAKDKASDAVASKALYASQPMSGFALANDVWSKG